MQLSMRSSSSLRVLKSDLPVPVGPLVPQRIQSARMSELGVRRAKAAFFSGCTRTTNCDSKADHDQPVRGRRRGDGHSKPSPPQIAAGIAL